MNEMSKMATLFAKAPATTQTYKILPLPKRISWIDAARGICIILVVIGHAINGIQGAGLTAREGMLYNIYYFIYTFHMPAFFVLSGLLAWPSVNKNGEKFFKNIIKNIAYPYFLYGSIQLLIMNVFSNQLNRPAPFDVFEFRYLFIGSPSQFWFLKTLFLMHVAYLISKKYINIHWFLLICITLRGCSELLPIPADLGGFSDFAIFYAIGILFSEDSIDWPSRCRFSLLWVGVFGFLWFVFATASLSIHDPIVGGSPLRGSLLPASIAGSLFVFALSGSKYIENISALLYIGRNTLPIFCLHVLFVAGTRIVLAKFFGISEVMLILPAAIFAGIAGPLMIVAIAERFRLRSALGLG
jgi:fucose 4-O-acetylase-like acetyltransferase